MFDPDSITPSKLNHLRSAAEQAWGDDTRHEKFIGHPCSCFGQCFVTSQWLTKHLGGKVGVKDGHHFWVSPDNQYAVDMTGDRFATPPVHPSRQFQEDDEGMHEVDPEQKTWRAGPTVYKRTDHPLFKGFRVLDDHSDHPRAQQFARKADLALSGKRVASVHVSDMLGPSGLQTEQQAEDYDMQSRPFPMLHDEPGYDPVNNPTKEYKWVYCNPAEAPIWMADMSFKAIGDIQVGDEVVGWDFNNGTKKNRRTLSRSTVTAIHGRHSEVVRVTFESGRSLRCTPDHHWLIHWSSYTPLPGGNKELFGPAKVGNKCVHVIDPTPSLDQRLMATAAWLGGIFDGEGCASASQATSISQCPDRNPAICRRIFDSLEALGISYGTNGKDIWLTGGRQTDVNFANWTNPTKRKNIANAVLGERWQERDRIVSIEPDGKEEVYGLTTTTGNYVAWGYASKNCNGQLHVSPIHSHEEMFDHAGANPASDGPAAVGFVTVTQNRAVWGVESNISLRGLHQVLSDYSATVGWEFGGMVGSNGQPLHDDFGPKQSMWFTTRTDGHLLLSERPLPNGQLIRISGKTAAIPKVSPLTLDKLGDWAKDMGYKLAEYPGGGDMTDKMKTRENLDMFNRGDTDFQPERANPDEKLEGPLSCGKCGAQFENLERLRVHERYDHRPEDYAEIEDGHFPHVQDFDIPLGYGTHPQGVGWNSDSGFSTASVQGPGARSSHRTATLVLPGREELLRRHPRFATYAKLFGYDTDEGHQFYGAYWDGQLVGYGAVRLNSETEPTPGAMYHVAPVAQRPAIETQGLRPNQPTPVNPRGVYLFDTHDGAQEWITRELPYYTTKPHEIHQVDVSGLPLEHDPEDMAVDDDDVSLTGRYYTPQAIPPERLQRVSHTEPEVVMIDATVSGQGVGSAILSLMQRHFDSFYTHADSEGGERLMRRLGMVNVSGYRWRWSKTQQPKDMIEAAIPLLYDFQQDHVHIGYPGQKTHDIQGKFSPGGVVEGYYEPGGKVILIPASNLPYSTRQFGQAWYRRFPQMEITKLEEEGRDGKTRKVAAENVGNYVRRILPTDIAAYKAYHALKEHGGKVYAVGGVVRDALQGREPNDIDLMVAGLPSEEIEQVLSGLGRMDVTGKRFGVFRLKIGGDEVEIALPRQDKYETSRRGEGVITVDHNLPVEKDLERRDFTANSMAVDLDTGALVDPYGGAHDAQANILRTTHPDSFQEDPSRLVRAIGMHGRFGLNPDERTRHEMETHGHLLRSESPTTLEQILTKSVFGEKNGNPAGSLRLAQETGMLPYLFPQAAQHWEYDQNNPHHNYKLGDHHLHVLDNISRLSSDPDLRLSAWLHDWGKPASMTLKPDGYSRYHEVVDPVTKEVTGADHAQVGAHMAEDWMRHYNYSRARINRVTDLVRHHMFGAFNSPKGARKFLQRVGGHADDLMDFREADMAGKGVTPEEAAAKQSVAKMRQLIDESRREQAPTDLQNLQVNGNDLISIGMKPGPQVGQVLRSLLTDVVDQPTLNNRDALLQRAQQYINALPQS